METQKWVGCPLWDTPVRKDSETLLWAEQARAHSRGHSSVEKAALGPQRRGCFKLCFLQQNGVTPIESKHTFPLHTTTPLLHYTQEDWGREMYDKIPPSQAMHPPRKTESCSWIPAELFHCKYVVLSCLCAEAFPCRPPEGHTPGESTDWLCILLGHEAMVCLYASVTKHLYFAICKNTAGEHFSEIPSGLYRFMLNRKI